MKSSAKHYIDIMANGKIVTKIVKHNQHEELLKKLILNANNFVILISPYWHHKDSTYPVYEAYDECIEDGLKRGIRFLFMCDEVDKGSINEHYTNLNKKYNNGILISSFGFYDDQICSHIPQRDVHAKIYMNERECVITSKNIAGLSSNSLDLGVYSNAKMIYKELFDIVKSYIDAQSYDVFEYFYSILPQELKNGIDNACPCCGGKLIYKNGKYGEFFGCSNYPNCKFTKNIE